MRSRTKQRHSPKRWLVLAAWPPELAELRRLLMRMPTHRHVTARAAGVGLVEAAIGATAAIAKVKPDAVMFVGTAGRYPARRPDLACRRLNSSKGELGNSGTLTTFSVGRNSPADPCEAETT